MLPQPLRLEDEPPPSPDPAPLRLRSPRLSARGRILRFALLAGCGWGAVLALATTIAMFMAPGRNIGLFMDRESNFEFFRTLFTFFVGFAPLLIVASAVAAGVHAVLREMSRTAAANRRSMAALAECVLQAPAHPREDGRRLDAKRAGILNPLKDLDLEIDPPGHER